MKYILVALIMVFLSLTACNKDDKNSGVAAPTENSGHPKDGKKPIKREGGAQEEGCLEADLLTCEQVFNLYVLSYFILPNEPVTPLKWTARLDVLESVVKSGEAITDELINENENLLKEAKAALAQPLKDCKTAQTEPSQCFDDPKNYESIVESIEAYQMGLVKAYNLQFLKKYVAWVKERKDLPSEDNIKVDEKVQWMIWMNHESLVVDEKKFLEFAKEKSHCESDKIYEVSLSDDKNAKPYKMSELLKEKICEGESLSIDERSMVEINFEIKK